MKDMIKPMGARILVKADPKKTESKGIIIPETAAQKITTGTVIAVGEGTETEPMKLKEGDKIMYGQYGGTEVTIGEESFLFMNQRDVWAKL